MCYQCHIEITNNDKLLGSIAFQLCDFGIKTRAVSSNDLVGGCSRGRGEGGVAEHNGSGGA